MVTKAGDTVLDLSELNQPIDMNGQAIIGLPTPGSADAVATKDYVDGLVGGGSFLPLTGGTMTGPINMGGNLVTGLGAPAVGSDAVSLSYYEDASNLSTGTLPTGRLTGTYNISVSGNAATATSAVSATTATTATNSTQLGGQAGSFYQNATNINAGTLNANRLATSGVVAGSYTNSNITVDNKGRVTAASNGTATGTIVILDDPVLLAGVDLSVNSWINLTHSTLTSNNATAALITGIGRDSIDIYIANPGAGSRPATPAENTWPKLVDGTGNPPVGAATSWVSLNGSNQLSYYCDGPSFTNEGYLWLVGYAV